MWEGGDVKEVTAEWLKGVARPYHRCCIHFAPFLWTPLGINQLLHVPKFFTQKGNNILGRHPLMTSTERMNKRWNGDIQVQVWNGAFSGTVEEEIEETLIKGYKVKGRDVE